MLALTCQSVFGRMSRKLTYSIMRFWRKPSRTGGSARSGAALNEAPTYAALLEIEGLGCPRGAREWRPTSRHESG
jgi:hypothetical protein